MNRQRRGAGNAGVGERVATTRLDVGRQVRLCEPELVHEAVLEDHPFVPVFFSPRIHVLVADVAHFHRHVVTDGALDARRPRVHTRLTQVGLEHVEAVVDGGRDRIHRCVRERRGAETILFAEQDRPAFARAHETEARARVARGGGGPAGVGAGVGREAVKPFLVVGQRVPGADRGLIRVAEDRAHDAALRIRPPREPEVVADVRVVDVVGLGAGGEGVVLRLRLAGFVAGLEQVAGAAVRARTDAGDAAQILERDRRERLRHRDKRQLHVPAQTRVDGQRGRHTPGVGRVGGKRVLTGLLFKRAVVDVLARRRVQTRRAGHRRDAAGHQRIQGTGVVEHRGGRTREVRRVEHARRRIVVGVKPDHHVGGHRVGIRAVVHPRERPAEREAVRTSQPAQVVVHTPRGRVARRRADRVDVRREERHRDGVAAHVVELFGRHVAEEVVGGPLPAALELVHHVLRERRAQAHRTRGAVRVLLTDVGKPGVPGFAVVEQVGIALESLPVVGARQPVFVGEVVVEATRRRVLVTHTLGLEHVLLRMQRRGVIDGPGGQRRFMNTVEQIGDLRVARRQVAVGRGQRQHIHTLDGAVARIPQNAVARGFIQNRARPRRRRRLVLVLEVQKKERLAPAVITGQHHGTTDTPTVLVDDDVVLLEVVDLVEEVVRVERGVTEVVVDARVELVGARPRDKRDLHRAGTGAHTGHGARDGDFLDGVHAGRDHREEAVS